MPDQTLLNLAGKGELAKPDVVAAQATRMLKDPRAKALADNFAGQWLQLRKLELVSPDTKLFADFDDRLRQAMRTETTMFFQCVVNEDRSILDFIDGRYTFVNAVLAKHYGMQGVEGDAFRRVEINDGVRGGVLTQASVLTVTSNPTRTSPVKRGKWVLENILGTPPPPPPPGAGTLQGGDEIITAKTVRERLEQHRKNPECASCHSRMDPIGFGMENFDATGAWRAKDGAEAIDASGVLPDGTKFDGPASLRTYLMAKKDLFVRALAEKMLTYAIGRGMAAEDKCHVDEIAKECRAGGYKFSALVKAVVRSAPFRKQAS
jgi:hypothetical protein